jgi:ABC-type Fe3+ transport system substrate-binding protein
VISAYFIGRVDRTGIPDAADLFIDFVLSDEGRSLLAARGFIVEP